jgi:hypothetical protein
MPQLELTKSELKTLLKLVDLNTPRVDELVNALPADDEARQKLETRHAKYVALHAKLVSALGEVPTETHDLALDEE